MESANILLSTICLRTFAITIELGPEKVFFILFILTLLSLLCIQPDRATP